MPVNFDQFRHHGDELVAFPYVWEYPDTAKTGLPTDAIEASEAALGRVYDSAQMRQIGHDFYPEGWGHNPPVDAEEASIIHFAGAFKHEAERDRYPASLILSFGAQKGRLETGLAVASGNERRSVLAETYPKLESFRILATILEAVYGVEDQKLTHPHDPWQFKALMAGRWTLMYHPETVESREPQFVFEATKLG